MSKKLGIILSAIVVVIIAIIAGRFIYKNKPTTKIITKNYELVKKIEEGEIEDVTTTVGADIALDITELLKQSGMEDMDGHVAVSAKANAKAKGEIIYAKGEATASMIGETQDANVEMWMDDDNIYYNLNNGDWIRSDKDALNDTINSDEEDEDEDEEESKLSKKEIYKDIKNLKKKIKDGTYKFEKKEKQYILTVPYKISDLKNNDVIKDSEEMQDIDFDAIDGNVILKFAFNEKTCYLEGVSVSFDKEAITSLEELIAESSGTEGITIEKCKIYIKFKWDEIDSLKIPKKVLKAKELSFDFGIDESEYIEEDEEDEETILIGDSEITYEKASIIFGQTTVQDILDVSQLSINTEYSEVDEDVAYIYLGDDLEVTIIADVNEDTNDYSQMTIKSIEVNKDGATNFNFLGITEKITEDQAKELLGEPDYSSNDSNGSSYYSWEIGDLSVNLSFLDNEFFSAEVSSY